MSKIDFGNIKKVDVKSVWKNEQYDFTPWIAEEENMAQTHIHVTNPVPRWNPLVAMLLSLLIPGLGQMYKGQVLNGVAWLIIVPIGYFAFIVPDAVLHLCCILGAGMGNPYQ